MKKKLSIQENILVGSLLFGLFFGAGNLIFPVHMGQLAGANTVPATIGFLLTGVGLPILGIVASALSQSESLFEMAKPVSRLYAVFFTCALYLTIGPLFAIPRTATVAFEVGLSPFVAESSLSFFLFAFSLIFFALTLFYSLRPGRIIDWVGKYLTPAFVGLLSILLLVTFLKPMGSIEAFPPQTAYFENPLLTGFLEGYNTMDALASLAFAIVILSNIEQLGIHDPKRKAIETLKSGIVCLVAMGVIYSALAYMGATSLGSVARAENGGLIMAMVSAHYFGLIGQILLAAIVFVACLKTAIGLITSCAQMFSELFPNSLSYRQYAFAFTLVSFGIANFGLSTIIQLSIPVLMFLYPLAITLIILSLLVPIIQKEPIIYQWTIGLTILAALFDFLNALPNNLKSHSVIQDLLGLSTDYLPGFAYGFGWIIPSMIGFTIGFVIWQLRREKV